MGCSSEHPISRVFECSGYQCLALLVLPLLQLLLSEVASHHRVAVLIDPVGEVLAGHAGHAAFPVLQVAFVDVVPYRVSAEN